MTPPGTEQPIPYGTLLTGCGCLLVLSALGGTLLYAGIGYLLRDDPPPYDPAAVVKVQRPASTEVAVAGERRHSSSEPLGLNGIKDEIHRDVIPKLGDSAARVGIDCGDAELADGEFVCRVSHRHLRIDYRVTVWGLFNPSINPTGRVTWKQRITPLSAPLVRQMVHRRLWGIATVGDDDDYRDLTCDRMPELSVVKVGTTTGYRCHMLDRFGHYITYRIRIDEDGDLAFEAVRAEDEGRGR